MIDAAVVVAALGISQTARFGLEFQGRVFDQVELTYLAFLPLIAAAWWMLLCVFGSRERRILGIGPDEYKRVIVSTFTLFGLLAIGCMALKIDASRGYFALAFPIGLAGLLTERWTMRRWLTTQRKYGHFLSRVIVLGKAKDVRYVVSQIDKKSGAAYQVVGAALTKRKQRNFVDVDGRKIPILAGMDSIGDAVVDYNVDAVIIAGPVNRGSKYVQQLGWKLEESKTELVLATGLTNVAGPRIHTRPVEGLPLMHVELPHYSGAKHVAKRVSDIVLSAFALTALMPVFVAFALLIKRDSAGPVFFRQKRVGRDGSTFEMCKFRSMRPNAEAELEALKPGNEGSGPLFKLHDDPRVTKVGKWMRKYSLDELPQFWNVFKGDMSIVGPRPPLASEVAEYAESVHRRLYIKPGITGMWQVNGRSELGWDDSVRLDLYYVENWSLTGDLIIMWRTFRVMIHPVGAY
nr:sugar transferase [Spelaeicoccus albus]